MIYRSKRRLFLYILIGSLFGVTALYWFCRVDILTCVKLKFPLTVTMPKIYEYHMKKNRSPNIRLKIDLGIKRNIELQFYSRRLNEKYSETKARNNLAAHNMTVKTKSQNKRNFVSLKENFRENKDGVFSINRETSNGSNVHSHHVVRANSTTGIDERYSKVEYSLPLWTERVNKMKNVKNISDETISDGSSREKPLKHPNRIGILRVHNMSCDSIYPDVLLYNRIFKTGSSSIGEYMKNLSFHLNYFVEMATTEDWYNTGDPYPYPDIIERHVGCASSRRVFAGHFFFRPDLKINRSFTYINIVREPVQRIISHYMYMRSYMRPKHRIIEMKRSGLWNESLFDCVKNEHRGCESNVMTRFFCGAKWYCRTGSRKALMLAKFNIKQYYVAVGLQEHIKLFLEVLTKTLPQFFNHSGISIPRVKRNTNKNNFRKVSARDLEAIRERNNADVRLYRFLKHRFQTHMKNCGISNDVT